MHPISHPGEESVVQERAIASPPSNSTAVQDQYGRALYVFIADFYSDYRRVRATLVSPEYRLSDHLNGSATSIDVEPLFAQAHGKPLSDLTQTRAQISKSRVLFVVPVTEPHGNTGSPDAWRETAEHRCWAALGPYNLMGALYTEPGRDPHIALVQRGKQFVPLTGVSLYCPDGTMEQHSVLLVNRAHLEVLAFRE
jgi:hypothetical protein